MVNGCGDFQSSCCLVFFFLSLETKKEAKKNGEKTLMPPAAFFRPTPLQGLSVPCFPFLLLVL
jgi:hypothetical protein